MKSLLFLKMGMLVAGSLFLTNCAQNPVTGRQNFVMVSEAEEIRIGKQADADVKKEYGAYQSAALQEYVSNLGRKLAQNSHRPQIEYHFTVLDSPDINAFALPGGYVYVTRGIIAYFNSEAELAAVLGHEIGHVTARHGVRQYSAAQAANIGVTLGSLIFPELRSNLGNTLINILGNAWLSGYGRDHELEADRLGAEYLARSGYNPQAMLKVIGLLKNQELFDAEVAKQEGRQPRAYHGLFATHPDNDKRLQEVVGKSQRLANPDAPDNRNLFLPYLNGLVFGDSPEQGVVRNHAFYHVGLGFGLKFPDNWRIKNQPDRVLAKSADGNAIMELRLGKSPPGSPADYLRKFLKLGIGSELQSIQINGLQAALTTTAQKGSLVRAAVIYLNDKAFIVVGAARSQDAFNRYLSDFNSAIKSFHRITEAEIKLAKPLAIKTIVAKKGETFAQLAQGSPLGKNAEGYLRLMNAAYPSGEPSSGQTIKIVE